MINTANKPNLDRNHAVLDCVAHPDDQGVDVGAALHAIKRVQRDQTQRQPGNATLNHASVAKKDEFYTQYDDVAKEMSLYGDQFRGKTVLCNCDDPFESAFFRYFTLNFNELGLTGLMSTSYAGSPMAGRQFPLPHGPGAYQAVVTHVPDGLLAQVDGSLDFETLFSLEGNRLTKLQGDGDFRSAESKTLLKQADIVATNPPFSLFREFISQLQRHNKQFLILGNMNAATYREVFPLFRNDQVWYGESIRSGDRKFYVPDDYPLNAAGCGVDEEGRRFIRVKGVRWFTNMENTRRHETLPLTRNYTPTQYPRYDNYNAIEVGRTLAIPTDYDGVMGVPITFLDRYNPEQFEIVMLANGNARTNVDPQTLAEVGYAPHPQDRGGVGMIDGRRSYARILIRKRPA